jgi:C-terminal peptidase prc
MLGARMRIAAAVLFLAVALTCATASVTAVNQTEAQTATSPPQSTPGASATVTAGQAASRQLRLFQQLWNIVNDRYVYPNFNGYDWPAARNDVEARITQGLTDDQFYDAMRDLIYSLNDDHSDFLSPDEARDEDDEYSGAGKYVGVGVITDANVDKRYIYVLQVFPDSPAARSGIQPHDHILEIDGQPVVAENGESRSQLFRGPEGSLVTALIRTPGGEPRRVEIQRANVSSAYEVDYRFLPDHGNKRIGYVHVPTLFQEDIGAGARSALRALMAEAGGKLDGVVVDMRTNGGGAYTNLRTMLGLFMRGTAGHLVDRHGVKSAIRIRSENIGNSQTVPLVVLIGDSTESYAEVFAGALQARGRAKLIGRNSAGNIETLLSHSFDDGSRLWLAEESFRLPDGSSWEGAGLRPDVRIDKGWDEYTASDDPVLAEAIRRLSD